MDCPSCHQATEPGAVFCGNCGQQLLSGVSPLAKAMENAAASKSDSRYVNFGQLATSGASLHVPRYAIPVSYQHHQTKLMIACVIALFGIGGSFLIPLSGIIFGIMATVLLTFSWHSHMRLLKAITIIAAACSIVAGLAVWIYVAAHNPRLHPSVASQPAAASAITAIGLSTPCYSLSFTGQLNVENTQGSCEMDAYNGSSLANSSNVFKVLTTPAPTLTQANFTRLTKQALQSDVGQNLPGFTITAEGAGTFASSQAYFINANNSSTGVAVEEGAVLHSSASGPTLYVLVHATFGQSTDLKEMEQHWQWK